MSVTSSVSDEAIFAAARRAYPDAVRWGLTSWIVAGHLDHCQWCLLISYGKKDVNRKWQIVTRGWSRAALLLALRSTSPVVKHLSVVATEPDERPGRHLVE